MQRMPKSMRLRMFVLLGLVQAGLGLSGLAADTLVWHTNAALVSADIRAEKLPWLLEKLTSSTGWQVYVEPEVSHTVSAKFKNLAPGEALRLLLGDLNFALIPEHNASPKLFVFRTSMGKATQRVQPAIIPRPILPAWRTRGRR